MCIYSLTLWLRTLTSSSSLAETRSFPNHLLHSIDSNLAVTAPSHLTMPLNSLWWKFLESTIYKRTEPPPRERTRPLKLICVGPPRSATESLAAGLTRMGLQNVYHGW